MSMFNSSSAIIGIFFISLEVFSSKQYSALPMRNVKAPVYRSFQSTKHPCSSSGSCQSNIQESPKSAWGSINTFHIVLLPVDFICSCVDLVQVQFGEQLSQGSTENKVGKQLLIKIRKLNNMQFLQILTTTIYCSWKFWRTKIFLPLLAEAILLKVKIMMGYQTNLDIKSNQKAVTGLEKLQ